MSCSKLRANHWQLGVYSPSSKEVVKKGPGCLELEGVSYPYRSGKFLMEWLEPYHMNHPEYWDLTFKPE